MTLPIYKNGEALYTVIIRAEDACSKLKKWLQTSKTIQAKVEDNRLSIYDHNTLCLFVIGWNHGFGDVMIWDQHLKRHIYF